MNFDKKYLFGDNKKCIYSFLLNKVLRLQFHVHLSKKVIIATFKGTSLVILCLAIVGSSKIINLMPKVLSRNCITFHLTWMVVVSRLKLYKDEMINDAGSIPGR